MTQLTHIGKNGQTHTYASMVAALFKPMDGVGARMMHACIGIAGESAELRSAASRENIIEECGDLEFYVEAAWQELPEGSRLAAYNRAMQFRHSTLGNVVNQVHTTAGNLLDFAKKVWVYQGVKGDRNVQIAEDLCHLEGQLRSIYHMIGVEQAVVQKANMVKLLGSATEAGRYETGQYSDEQALARNDKVEAAQTAGADRQFFSDRK